MAHTDWRALFAFEARYQLRRWSFAVLTLALCGFAVVMVRTGYAPDGTTVNAPAAVMQSLGLLSLWALFTQTIFTVHGVLRDVEHGMTELIETRPLSRGLLLAVRTAGVAGAGILAFAIATVVLMIGPLLLVSDAAQVGPVRLDAYVVPFLTLVVPNLLLVTALVIAVAAIWRSTVATYVGAVGLFATYMLTALAVSSPIFAGGAPATPESLAQAAILDPFGLSAFFEQARYWTIAQRERELVSLSGRYLINRALWLAVGLVVCSAAVRLLAVPSHRRPPGRRASAPDAERETRPAARRPYHPVMPSTTGFAAALASTWRMELRLLAASWPIRALLLGLAVVVTIELFQNLGAGEYGTRLLATSSELARRAGDPVAILGALSLVYLAGDVMWRERAARMDQLVDASPRSGTVAVWGKLLALVTLASMLVVLAQLVAVVVQLVIGGAAVEWRVFAAHALSVAWPLALWAIMFGALQALAGQRWGGLLLGVVLVVISLTGAGLCFEHPMTRFPARPDLRWSDLDGFGPSLPSFTAFMVYWSAVAITVGVAASGVWPRGAVRRLSARIAGVMRPEARPWRRAMTVMSMTTLVAASALWKVTWADGRWSSAESSRQWRAGYERQFRRLARTAQPDVQHADLRVELQPLGARAQVSGSLRLVNQQTEPVDTVWLFIDPGTQVHRLTAGTTAAVRPDARYSMYAIPLSRALRTGDTITLSYLTSIDRTPIRASGYDRMLTDNGSYLTTTDLIPELGYRGRLEIADPATRTRFALGAATPQLRPLDDTTDRVLPRGWMTSRVIVATDSAQIPLATGEARRTWLEGGRRLAEFRFDSVIPPRLAVLSARYTVRRRTLGPTTVEVWYHPSHDGNVDRILDAATISLRVLGRLFGRYPQPTLRIVELPSGWGFGAFAMPGTILLTEDRGMRLDARSESVDLLLRRIGHEVAHQWWGGDVVPADVAGAGLIVEGLAKYSEQRIVADVHGDSALPAMLAFDHDRYLAGRGRETGDERSLASAGYDDDYLFYGKAAIGFNALHAALGDAAMTRALRTFLRGDRGPAGSATTRSLRNAFVAEARTPQHLALLHEWFDERIIHDLAIDTAVTVTVSGGYQLTARGHAERITRRGTDDAVTPAAALEIEVLIAGAGSRSWAGRVMSGRDGRYTLTVSLPFQPTAVTLDPAYHRIDRNRSNNQRRVSRE